MEPNQRYLWHYLHHAYATCTLLTRIDEQHVEVALPNAITGVEERYVVPMDARDQRTLVAFDGLMLAGSPKRKGACILRFPIGTLQVSRGQFYAPEDDVFGIPPYTPAFLPDGKEVVRLEIYRYFLLLRAGTFVFAAYDNTNLAPRYLVAIVRRRRKGEGEKEDEEQEKEWIDWLVGG